MDCGLPSLLSARPELDLAAHASPSCQGFLKMKVSDVSSSFLTDFMVLAVCVPLIFWSLWSYHESFKRPLLYHVQVKSGGIVYQDYWTTNPPPPHKSQVPWYAHLNLP